jgi:hypothetical protein
MKSQFSTLIDSDRCLFLSLWLVRLLPLWKLQIQNFIVGDDDDAELGECPFMELRQRCPFCWRQFPLYAADLHISCRSLLCSQIHSVSALLSWWFSSPSPSASSLPLTTSSPSTRVIEIWFCWLMSAIVLYAYLPSNLSWTTAMVFWIIDGHVLLGFSMAQFSTWL